MAQTWLCDPAASSAVPRSTGRSVYARRIGADERGWPAPPSWTRRGRGTVRTDVERVLWAEEIPPNVTVSGHVYDIATGLVTMVVDSKSRK